VAEIEFLK